MYQVLLYYKYIQVENPERVRDKQRQLCDMLDLKGRIIVAKEGINGTVEGLVADTEKYIQAMEKQELFKDISYKKSVGTGHAFPKLRVRVRPEIVTTGITNLDPNKITGKYITAKQLYTWFATKKEFYIVDMRNQYEYASGYFDGFVASGLKNFFELQNVLPRIEHLKGKTIVTVCTGGVRCEKASGYLLANGFEDVYQLKDGIQTFIEKYPNTYFKGKLYVFDNRLTLGFHTDDLNHEVVGKCFHCGKAGDSYVNCQYNVCHLHYICCKDCRDKETGFAFCKKECKEKWQMGKNQVSVHYF